MSSSTTIVSAWADRDYQRVLWLTLALFLSYLCVAMSLPVMSIYVTTRLGFGNALAGLAVGIAFASTILTIPAPWLAPCRAWPERSGTVARRFAPWEAVR